MQNRGILITLRAAAIVIIVTGLNDVIASAVPRYEPLYLYLAGVVLVALMDGILLGIAAGVLSIAFYALLFMPRADALSAAIIIPAAAALGVAVVGALIRGFVRVRRRKREPVLPVMPPLLETSAVAHVTDNEEVLAAIDELRNELRTAIADLNASRGREVDLADRTRSHSAELEAMEVRLRQFEKDRDWALKIAEEGRARADRERGLRADADRLLAEAREESATMAGRLAELELSLLESERLQRDAAALRARIAELEKAAAAATRAAADAAAQRQRAEEQMLAEAREESAGLRTRIAELERAAAAAAADAAAQRQQAEERSRSEERLLAEARQQTAALRTRIAELEKAVAAATPLSEVDELRHVLSETRTLYRQAAADAAGQRQRADEQERLLAAERATREKLEEESSQFDKKLQTIVTHLASDHETDLGQALSEKEEARAEVRAVSMKLSALQKKYDEESLKLRDAETLLAETRAAAQAEIDRLRAAVAPQPARPRVMIVHPDADIRATAGASLERAGYEVVTAADGLEALRVAIARQPEVVIAETSMPKMDGRELCQLLKSQEKTAHIRVVLLMRANDEEPRGELPPDEILRKPVPVETLKATLANLLARV